MDTAVPPAGNRNRPRPRRWFVVGFLVGALILVPVAMLALVLPAAEYAAPFLTPGVVLLLPLNSWMADWPDVVNLVLGSLANGVAFGLVAALVAVVLGRRG
jgi:hypothetical protein